MFGLHEPHLGRVGGGCRQGIQPLAVTRVILPPQQRAAEPRLSDRDVGLGSQGAHDVSHHFVLAFPLPSDPRSGSLGGRIVGTRVEEASNRLGVFVRRFAEC